MVTPPGFGAKIEGCRSSLRRSVFSIIALTLTQGFIATVEVSAIAQGRPFAASLWAALNSAAWILGMLVIVVEPKRYSLVIPYILASAIATYIGVWVSKFL